MQKPRFADWRMRRTGLKERWVSRRPFSPTVRSDVKVARSLDSVYGLDEAAVKAMKQWEFKPGLKDGKPVAVRISVDMAFTLK